MTALAATGAVRIYLALHMRDGGPCLWIMMSGAITTLLGLVILFQWPTSSLYTLGIFLGVDLVFAGISWLSIGMALPAHSFNSVSLFLASRNRQPLYDHGRSRLDARTEP